MSANNNHPKISIIIPLYNTELYIEECANSLLHQTYPNIEFIFINDCSTDRSLERLTQIANRFNNRDIKIITNPQNIGVSASRNIGIDVASGEYITFCDSDDRIETCAIEKMIETAQHTCSDIVVCPFFSDSQPQQFPSNDIADLNNIAISNQYFSLWNKLFKAKLIKDNQSLPNVNYWEDLSIMARIYANAPKVELLNTPFYHYRKFRQKALTTDSQARQLNDRLKYTDFLIQWFEKRGLTSKYERFLNHLKFIAKIKMLRTSPRQYRRWKHTFPESNQHIMSYTDIPLHYRILFSIAVRLIP